MRIVIVTAMWRRPHLTSIMLDSAAMQKARLAGEIELDVAVAGSEGVWSRYLAESHGAYYVEVENKPLGAKWQAALGLARQFRPDAVLVLGSDNVCNDALLRFWAERLALGDEYIGLFDAYQWNPSVGTLVHWDGYEGLRAGEPIGSSRCFSRGLLDRLGWHLWEPGYNRGLDWSATKRLETLRHRTCFVTQVDRPLKHLGIKVDGAMSPSLHRHKTCRRLDPQILLDWFGDDIGARALALGNVRARQA